MLRISIITSVYDCTIVTLFGNQSHLNHAVLVVDPTWRLCRVYVTYCSPLRQHYYHLGILVEKIFRQALCQRLPSIGGGIGYLLECPIRIYKLFLVLLSIVKLFLKRFDKWQVPHT